MGSLLRRPLVLFAAILLVGLAVLAIGMKATGGNPGLPNAKPLSPRQFRRANQHICLFVRGQLESLVARGKPRNLRQAATYLRRAVSIFDQLRTDYYGLVPPRSDAAAFRRLLRHLDVADRAMHRLNHLSETRQWRSLVLLVRSRWFRNIFGPPQPHMNPAGMCRAPHTIV